MNQKYLYLCIVTVAPCSKLEVNHCHIIVKTGIILKWLYLGKSAKNEAEDRKLQVEQVNNVIYEFREIMKSSKRVRKKVNMKRNKLTKVHLHAPILFANEHMEKGFTLMEARKHLEALIWWTERYFAIYPLLVGVGVVISKLWPKYFF